MNKTLKFISDTKLVDIDYSYKARAIYPLSAVALGKSGSIMQPILTGACAWIGTVDIQKAFESDESILIQFDYFRGISKETFDLISKCEQDSLEMPVIGYFKDILWIGLESDLREFKCRNYNEL